MVINKMIYNACNNYFNMFKEVSSAKTSGLMKLIAVIKIISLATIFVPVLFGVAYGASYCLKGRVKKTGTGVSNIMNKKTDVVSSSKLQNVHTLNSFEIEKIKFNFKVDCLKKKINDLKSEGGSNRKKALLYEKGLNHLRSVEKEVREPEIYVFKKRRNFFIKDNQDPKYFNESAISLSEIKGSFTSEYYDYQEADDNEKEFYWVDFANRRLGGGCFEHNFAMEEILVAEMSALAFLIASNLNIAAKENFHKNWCTIRTRKGKNDDDDDNRVMKGSPSPLVIKGLKRVCKVDTKKAYGHKFHRITEKKLLETTDFKDKPDDVNLIAITAPKLINPTIEKQTHINTIKDLFNTVTSGFLLAKKTAEKRGKKCVIRTGPIGGGAFHNNRIVALLLQEFAAQNLDLEIHYYGYQESQIEIAKKIWKEFTEKVDTSKNIGECLNILQSLFKEILRT